MGDSPRSDHDLLVPGMRKTRLAGRERKQGTVPRLQRRHNRGLGKRPAVAPFSRWSVPGVLSS
jgi:hypothetical protein